MGRAATTMVLLLLCTMPAETAQPEQPSWLSRQIEALTDGRVTRREAAVTEREKNLAIREESLDRHFTARKEGLDRRFTRVTERERIVLAREAAAHKQEKVLMALATSLSTRERRQEALLIGSGGLALTGIAIGALSFYRLRPAWIRHIVSRKVQQYEEEAEDLRSATRRTKRELDQTRKRLESVRSALEAAQAAETARMAEVRQARSEAREESIKRAELRSAERTLKADLARARAEARGHKAHVTELEREIRLLRIQKTESATKHAWAYGMLGVDIGAKWAECKSGFRRRAQDTHPDQNPDRAKEDANRDFNRVRQAYDLLLPLADA